MMHDTPLGPNDLELRRTLRAAPAAVWRCWTEPALIEQWFCPRPWRATDVVVDLRPGGAFATVIRGPGGEVFQEPAGSFLEVAPVERLAWTSALGPGWRPNEIAADRFAMTVHLAFRPTEDGGTHYIARVLHANADSRARHEAMGFADGWGAAADQLAALAATL